MHSITATINNPPHTAVDAEINTHYTHYSGLTTFGFGTLGNGIKETNYVS